MTHYLYALRVSWVNSKWIKENPIKVGDLFPHPKIGDYAVYYHNAYGGNVLTTTTLASATMWTVKQEAKKAAAKHNDYAGLFKVEVVEFIENGVIK